MQPTLKRDIFIFVQQDADPPNILLQATPAWFCLAICFHFRWFLYAICSQRATLIPIMQGHGIFLPLLVRTVLILQSSLKARNNAILSPKDGMQCLTPTFFKYFLL